MKIESYMQIVFLVSAAALFAPVIISNGAPNADGSINLSIKLRLLAFVLFEACVGIFWPSIMKLRSQYIPEEQRSTIMNFFRIPLNVFVCVVLYNVNYFSMATMFSMCASFLGLCFLCQQRLSTMAASGMPVLLPPFLIRRDADLLCLHYYIALRLVSCNSCIAYRVPSRGRSKAD